MQRASSRRFMVVYNEMFAFKQISLIYILKTLEDTSRDQWYYLILLGDRI